MTLYGGGGVVCLVLGGECAAGHTTEGICGTNLNNALGALLGEDDILSLNPSNGRGELVGEQLHQQGVSQLLLNLRTHGELYVCGELEYMWSTEEEGIERSVDFEGN